MTWQDKISHVYQMWENDSPFFEIRTSGSTGIPKLISLEKSKMEASAKMSLKFFGLKEGEKTLLALPADKIGGAMLIVRSIVGKLNLLAIEPRLDPFAGIELDSPISFCSLTPAQLSSIIKSKESQKQLSKIRIVLLGGSAIPGQLEKRILDLNNQFFHSYGMTETISHVAIRNLSLSNSYFEALDGVSFETQENKQLIISAPEILDNPLISNDVVDLISESKMIWKGRVDNVVNSGGVKIIVEEVEKEIRRVFSGEFYLLGKKDPVLGEALIMVSKTTPPTFDFLPKHFRPKEVFISQEFQYTKNQKLLRQSPQQLLNGYYL